MGTALVTGDPDFHLTLQAWRGSSIPAPNCSTTTAATITTRLQNSVYLTNLKISALGSSEGTMPASLASAAPMCRLKTSYLPSDAIVIYAGVDGFADVVLFPPRSYAENGGVGGHVVYISNTFLESPRGQWRTLFMDLIKMLALRQTAGWSPAVPFSLNVGSCVTCRCF